MPSATPLRSDPVAKALRQRAKPSTATTGEQIAKQLGQAPSEQRIV